MNDEEVLKSLKELPVPAMRYLQRTTSTNDVSAQWVKEGVEHLSLVVADEQTAGRGRYSRRWITPPASALAFTLILRPRETISPQFFAALGALAVCRAIESLYKIEARVKWPNDVLVNGSKVAGILVENIWLGEQLEASLLGIGVNVRKTSVPRNEVLSSPATSIEEASGIRVERTIFLKQILMETIHMLPLVEDLSIIKLWNAYLTWKGEEVILQDPIGEVICTGKLRGISENGELILEKHGEDLIYVSNGDISLRVDRSE